MDDGDDYNNNHRMRVIYQVDIRYFLRDNLNRFEISESLFRKLYRLPQYLVFVLVDVITPYTAARVSPAHIPLEIKVLCALAFFASGSYQRVIGSMSYIPLSQSSVSNFIEEITMALNSAAILMQYIHFPSTHEAREIVMQRNFQLLGMPRTLGYIDGSSVKIVPPQLADNREAYYGRKHYTAINVQIVCDAELRILSVDARFPGSCNDPAVYLASGMRAEMREAYQESRCWLLGDSVYPFEPWLHIPIHGAQPGSREAIYSTFHCQCRNVVERCIGVLKGRWRCLLHDRTLHYHPVKCGMIVNACVVLHNFCRNHFLPDPEPRFFGYDPDDDDNDDGEQVEVDDINAAQLRRLAEEEREFLIDHAVAVAWARGNV